MPALPQTVIAQALGVPASEIRIEPRPRLEHQRNNLYDAWAGTRHMVVKEYPRTGEGEQALEREAGALRLLAPLDIAPRFVLTHTPGSPELGPFVVYDWMEGEMWDRRCPVPRELEQLAELWLTLHAIPVDGLWMSPGYGHSLHQTYDQFVSRFMQYVEWARVEYHAAAPAIELSLQQLERRRTAAAALETLWPIFRLCRSDARFANIIARPSGRLGLVDWEECGLRDPAREIADLLTAANQEDLLSWTEWQVFLKPYIAGRVASDPGLERRTELYLEAFPILRLTILIGYGLQRARSGQLAGWTINGMPANHRLRRYLARSLAWPKQDFADELDTLVGFTFFPEE